MLSQLKKYDAILKGNYFAAMIEEQKMIPHKIVSSINFCLGLYSHRGTGIKKV